jgi:hypothetical protein
VEIDKERELYKIEQTQMEDEISTVTNSLYTLGNQIMIKMLQDMMVFSGNMRAELADMKNILLGINNKIQHLQEEKPIGVQQKVNRHHRHPTMRKWQHRQESPHRIMTSHDTVCVSLRPNKIFHHHR